MAAPDMSVPALRAVSDNPGLSFLFLATYLINVSTSFASLGFAMTSGMISNIEAS